MYITWKEWRQLKKEINQIVTIKLPEWERPITALDSRGIRQDIEWLFDDLESQVPEKWKTILAFRRRPSSVGRKGKKRNGTLHYFRVYDSAIRAGKIEELPCAVVLLVFADDANNGEKVNRRACSEEKPLWATRRSPGKRESGEQNCIPDIKKLTFNGFLVNVKKHPKTGTWVRRWS